MVAGLDLSHGQHTRTKETGTGDKVIPSDCATLILDGLLMKERRIQGKVRGGPINGAELLRSRSMPLKMTASRSALTSSSSSSYHTAKD